jgi:hypothetical protein
VQNLLQLKFCQIIPNFVKFYEIRRDRSVRFFLIEFSNLACDHEVMVLSTENSLFQYWIVFSRGKYCIHKIQSDRKLPVDYISRSYVHRATIFFVKLSSLPHLVLLVYLHVDRMQYIVRMMVLESMALLVGIL